MTESSTPRPRSTTRRAARVVAGALTTAALLLGFLAAPAAAAEDDEQWFTFNAGRASESFYISRSASRDINNYLEENASGPVTLGVSGAGLGCAATALTGVGAPVGVACAALTGAFTYRYTSLNDAAKKAVKRDSCIKIRFWGHPTRYVDGSKLVSAILTAQIDETERDNKYCID